MDRETIKMGAWKCRERKQNFAFLTSGFKSSALAGWMAPLTSTKDTKRQQKKFYSQCVYYITNKTFQVQYYYIPVYFWNTVIGFQIE